VASLLAQNYHRILSWQESGVYEAALKALECGVEQSLEVQVVTTFGKELWLRLNFSSILAKNEKHLLVFSQDISLRKKSEEAIQQRLIALTQPLESDTITFGELFNIEDVQKLQDEFARATGVASVITNTAGFPLTAPSNFTRFCTIIRGTEKGCDACFRSDALLGRYNPDGPNIQPCLSGGLWDAGAGIVVGGQHIANWLVGQVRDEAQTDEIVRGYAREIGVNEAVFIEAFYEIPSMSRDRFEQIARALFTLANQLSRTAYQNMQQARFINERNKAEEEKARLESQLLQAQKMESVGRLAGGVAHDFNNMLTVILGQAEIGLMKIDPDHPLATNFKEIITMAERSADLTRQLLAFARKQTVAPKVLDLNQAIAATLKMLQRLIGEDIRLVWLPDPGLWQIKMDPSQIDQLLANLCVNARDAIEDTGVITIKTENRFVDEEFCSAFLDSVPGEYVALSIHDSGRGMDKDLISHIFEPFFTTKEQGKGTGLGLSTVYGIVKQNNGFIDIDSEPGQGTSFSIYLPRNVGPRSRTVAKVDALPAPRGQETILVVEDETSILEIVTEMLAGQGYSVLSASTPGEAISVAREHGGEIHLLMTDVVMPEMNGRDLAKNLLSLYPRIKRLFMSGYTSDVIAHHGVLDEGVHFIQKPFSLPIMASKVREVLDSDVDVKNYFG
jgi:signal transduction histidine kinase/CheY-like chemotaxis protein